MRRGFEIMVREDSEFPLLINKTWVCVDFREVFHQAMVFEDCFNEEKVGITYNPQLATDIAHKHVQFVRW